MVTRPATAKQPNITLAVVPLFNLFPPDFFSLVFIFLFTLLLLYILYYGHDRGYNTLVVGRNNLTNKLLSDISSANYGMLQESNFENSLTPSLDDTRDGRPRLEFPKFILCALIS